jgi:hypothetical protein
VFLPNIPSLCTLELAYRFEPTLSNHRLPRAVLRPVSPTTPRIRPWGMPGPRLSSCAATCSKPKLKAEAPSKHSAVFRRSFPPPTGRTSHAPVVESHGPETGVAVPYLAQVVASLGPVDASEKLAPYMDLLDRVMEDSQVTKDEAQALRGTAEMWGLSMEDVVSAHHAYLEALVASAIQDERITSSERRELESATRLLAIAPSILDALITRGMEDPG